jgi:hypothetical protein
VIGWSMAELDALYWDDFLKELEIAHELQGLRR